MSKITVFRPKHRWEGTLAFGWDLGIDWATLHELGGAEVLFESEDGVMDVHAGLSRDDALALEGLDEVGDGGAALLHELLEVHLVLLEEPRPRLLVPADLAARVVPFFLLIVPEDVFDFVEPAVDVAEGLSVLEGREVVFLLEEVVLSF